jgi:hypothetical protein
MLGAPPVTVTSKIGSNTAAATIAATTPPPINPSSQTAMCRFGSRPRSSVASAANVSG